MLISLVFHIMILLLMSFDVKSLPFRVSDEKSARTYLNTVATRLKDDVDTLKNNFTALNRVSNA